MPVWVHRIGKVVLNEHLLQLHGNLWLRLLGVARFDVSLVCVGVSHMKKLNKQYRNVDQPTDVLSFPFQEVHAVNPVGILHVSIPFQSLEPGTLPGMEQGCELGDVFLCIPVVAKQQCGSEGLQGRLAVLALHGILHTLGYTHSSPDRWKEVGGASGSCDPLQHTNTHTHTQMREKEASLLTSFNNTFGTHLEPLTDQH